VRPSAKGIVENIIAWAILAIGAWLIHHFHLFSDPWNDLLIIALAVLAVAVAFRFRIANRLGRSSPSPQQPSGIASAITSSVVASQEETASRIRNSPELERVSRLLGTELRRMRVLIEQVKATNPMAYSLDFRLPVSRWEASEETLAHYRDRYGPVERAYDGAKSLNEVLRLREERQRAAGGPLYDISRAPLAVNAEDGLDRVHGLAGEALDALGERHNDPFQSDPPHEEAAEKLLEHRDDEGELFDNLFPFRRRGLDILSRRNGGVDSDLVDRAAEKWMDGVRELTEGDHPEFALHFTIPEYRSGPRHEGQGRRLTELVPRLNVFLRDLRSLRITWARYGAGDKTIDVRERLNRLIEDGRLNFIVDQATMGGDPAPGEEKRLILRWVQDGVERNSSFDVGTHVGLPDPKEPSP
jgi:hypothetical protein